jgi:hypothetical protein
VCVAAEDRRRAVEALGLSDVHASVSAPPPDAETADVVVDGLTESEARAILAEASVEPLSIACLGTS